MNRVDLNNKLYYVRNKVDKNNALHMLDILDEIFEFKPVTILYFNVRAEVLCKIGKYEEAIEILKFKINLCFLEEEYLETCKILQEAYKAIDSDTYYRQWRCLEFYISYMFRQDELSLNMVKELEEKIINMEDSFLDNSYKDEIEMKLADTYWESWYALESTIMYACAIRRFNLNYKNSMWFKDRIDIEINHIFLLDQLLYKKGTFILVANVDNYTRVMVLAKVIKGLDQEVYVMMSPVFTEVDKDIDINETVGISVENTEVNEEGIIKIRPIEISFNNKKENNIDLLLEEIVKSKKDDFAIVIGKGELFNLINKTENVKKRMQRLTDFKGEYFEKNLVFGYFGSYLSYISNIYLMDVKNEIEKPSRCEFSVVIPVRNSAESLRHTLKTCLEQRGIGKKDYEIIVSDNSGPDYMGVENLVEEIDDSRIRYFRTPRELPVGKNFEYAFIKAKGDFVFSLGADDGLLPWGLETIRKALKMLPDDDVIQWDRGFFVWPNNNKMNAQAGQFVIPRAYKKEEQRIEKYICSKELFSILNNPSLIYGLPMLYINSGFRRRYIKKVFEFTGRLWDGGSQDVYMGIVNLAINETIPYMNSPITIAGMTSSSIGISGNNGYDTNKEYINKIAGYHYSGYGKIASYNEELKFACVGLDISLLYARFFRVLNVYGSEKLNLISSQLDLKKILELVASRLNLSDLRFDYYIKSLRYSAYYNNYELGEWFDNNVLGAVNEPKIIKYNTEKVYSEGFTANGGLQLDSRKFNVNNIYEATKFFENICNL